MKINLFEGVIECRKGVQLSPFKFPLFIHFFLAGGIGWRSVKDVSRVAVAVNGNP